MAAFVKFNHTSLDIANGVHQFLAAGHTLKVYLSNTTPNVSTMAIKANLAEITNENGYAAPVDIQNDTSLSTATTSVTAVDVVITATTGTIGPFRYAVIYNDTPSAPVDPLIGYYDYGTSLTLQIGETFTVDFGSSLFTLA